MALSGSSDTLSFSFDSVLPGKYKGQDSPPTAYIHNYSNNDKHFIHFGAVRDVTNWNSVVVISCSCFKRITNAESAASFDRATPSHPSYIN